ncbi:MAG: hypothetical protein KC910_30850, partial [Candidatus Eremiobacteraeota bacterium]|nr:hypothetical protein [Candidatus Eremiobacteraeota bacterium]
MIESKAPTLPSGSPTLLVQLVGRLEGALADDDPVSACRYLRDALVLLTSYFAGAATGALKSVGPFSHTITYLLEDSNSILQCEKLLRQAFTDWQAHPHHPAYESLRDVFYISSRLQSSRLAPRRHTRWLQVAGKPVLGLEELPKWTRRLRLRVASGDVDFCREQLAKYLPLLHVWVKACSQFFQDWSQAVEPVQNNGSVDIKVVLKKDDVRFELTPHLNTEQLESEVTLSNGNLELGELGAITSLTGVSSGVMPAVPSSAPTSALPELPRIEPEEPALAAAPEPAEATPPAPEPAPTPVPESVAEAPVPTPEPVSAEAEEEDDGDIQLVWDEATGSYRVVAAVDPDAEIEGALPVTADEPEPTPAPEPVAEAQPEPAPAPPEPEPTVELPTIPAAQAAPAAPAPDPGMSPAEWALKEIAALQEQMQEPGSEPAPAPTADELFGKDQSAADGGGLGLAVPISEQEREASERPSFPVDEDSVEFPSQTDSEPDPSIEKLLNIGLATASAEAELFGQPGAPELTTPEPEASGFEPPAMPEPEPLAPEEPAPVAFEPPAMPEPDPVTPEAPPEPEASVFEPPAMPEPEPVTPEAPP